MAKEQKTTHDKTVKRTPLLVKIFLVILFSIIMSICMEWVGMAFFWPEEGSKHAYNMMVNEYEYLHEDFQHGLIVSPAHSANQVLGYWQSNVVGQADIARFQNWAASYAQETNTIQKYMKAFSHYFMEYFIAAIYIIQIFLMRLVILVFSIPMFALFAVIGIVDGLTQRDVRKWSGGRESGLIYHTSKAFIFPSFAIAWIAYLSLPVSVHPNFIVIPCAIITALLLSTASSSFKKYL
ncbi:TIGR03747 family integrating conjugative element membrane protein [Motilimonas eburnea]|uniref:TIGR03747 family integrating conjugative element membrane protein n=1 Tax=Motilimonas eburnea TaxID=1737488 RepID=UPI001E3DAD46|nr:TIGR03747 family integrating conjugative element membrane protein [Motilimonas eburnea]MCE2573839.1 TIGR03747 family integrating conjugative element membrane protein [Motilimonas eburnea]